MRLFIAEKPSQARAIAAGLPGPHSRKDGYIETGTAYVSWCVGHLLENAPPDAYDPKYEKFPGSFDDLPIIPSTWILQVSGDKGKQVRAIKDLLKKCTEVVNAGDPGREGQLIVDELLEYLGNRKPVLRLSLNATDKATVARELGNLVDNAQFLPLYEAGKGRQRADWLIGMSMSRAYSILGGAAGYRGVLSVGRVQSPTLAIVVRRDRDIDSFVPVEYWSLKALFEADNAGTPAQFWAAWLPPGAKTTSKEDSDGKDPAAEEADEEDDEIVDPNRPAWLDEKNRINNAAKANEIAAKIKGKTGSVIEAVRIRAQEQPPRPFELSNIQVMANTKWGASIKEALDACQSLYDKGLTTYPRTECTYLPESQHAAGPNILAAIGAAYPSMAALVAGADSTLKSSAWDDKKLGEHHAIIPTEQAATVSGLSPLESKIYEAVCLRYLAQFYPPTEVDKTKIVIDVEQETFIVRGRIIISPGWRDVYALAGAPQEDEEEDGKGAKAGDPKNPPLPPLNVGDPALCVKPLAEAKKTTKPPHYTQATLLLAMENVHTLVADKAVRKKLKSVEGIGRSATRAAIVETILRRKFIEPKGRFIVSSAVGKALVDALPRTLVDPALTAMWETALDAVGAGRTTLDAFMAKQHDWLYKLIEAAKVAKIENLPPSEPYQPKAGSKPGAKGSGPSKPLVKVKGAKTCPKCKKGQMVERVAKAGPNAGNKFLGCTNYPACKNAESVPPP